MTIRPDFKIFTTDCRAVVPENRRPRSLVAAARAGKSGWRRERHLRQLLQRDDLPAPALAVMLLRMEERLANEARLAGAADYDVARHVLLAIGVLAEKDAAGMI